MGQSSNPKNNTALAQDLAAIDRQATTLTTTLEQQLAQSGTQMTQTANQLIQTGASTTQIAAQLPLMVQELNIKLSQMTSTSIANFAAALNGRSGVGGAGSGVNINLSGISPTGQPTATQ
jgi:septal ring factor EnvC (AmiA/AmiB activator)